MSEMGIVYPTPNQRELTTPYQLDSISVLAFPLRFAPSSLDLHGLERLGQVVTLGEVLGPLNDVGLQESRLLVMVKHSLGCVCVCVHACECTGRRVPHATYSTIQVLVPLDNSWQPV